MKLTKKPTAPKAKGVKPNKSPKKSFDFKSFMAEVNSLNGQNYGSAPLAVKIFLLVVMALILSALAWFLLINPKVEEIKSAEAQEETLLQQYTEKESKARHLEEYKQQVAQMQIEFRGLLNQLPKDTRIPDLVDSISMAGASSGVRFRDITADPEVEQEFFVEQPISITAVGNYHQFGGFISSLARLPRIITLHDFEVINQLDGSGGGTERPNLDRVPELQLILKTKTYRSRKIEEQPAADADGAPADATTTGANP